MGCEGGSTTSGVPWLTPMGCISLNKLPQILGLAWRCSVCMLPPPPNICGDTRGWVAPRSWSLNFGTGSSDQIPSPFSIWFRAGERGSCCTLPHMTMGLTIWVEGGVAVVVTTKGWNRLLLPAKVFCCCPPATGKANWFPIRIVLDVKGAVMELGVGTNIYGALTLGINSQACFLGKKRILSSCENFFMSASPIL